MTEGSRQRPEMNVSFAALSGSSMNAPAMSQFGTTSRMDWSTSITGLDGRGRSTTSRSRSQASVRADSIRRSEGRRMSQDTRRYMQAAAASTQTTVQQLLSRLQGYRTFQPYMAHHLPYTSPRAEEGASRANSLARRRASERTVTAPQLWQMMNGLLDTSVAHLLQHNAEDHFIVTLQSTLGRELTPAAPKVRTVIESRGAHTAAAGARSSSTSGEFGTAAPAGGAGLSAMNNSGTGGGGSQFAAGRRVSARADTDLLMDRWAAEHPSATAEEVARQRQAWNGFDEQRRAESRRFYLKAMQRQLDALQQDEEQAGTSATSNTATSLSHQSEGRSRLCYSQGGTSLRDAWNSSGSGSRPLNGLRSGNTSLDTYTGAASEEEMLKEAGRQRALWLTFQEKPPSQLPPVSAAPNAFAASSFTTGRSPPQPSHETPRIVTAYLESEDLHQWLHSSWAHRTHRHESAALRIQCAFRVYRARCEVRRMRYARHQSFIVGLAAEAEAKRVWDVALQVQADASKTVSGGDGTMRALQFFIDKINAVVAKRRARKRVQQEQELEEQHYAAVSIQRVFRGHRARIFVEELRHPEIVAERRHLLEQQCALVLQTCWRRYSQQRRWRRMRRAACTLQRAYRCRAARRLLAERRRVAAVSEQASLQRFAVHRIEVWYARFLATRNAFAAAHEAEMALLQRVGRGYVQRELLGTELRMARWRAAAQVVERHRVAVLQVRVAVRERETREAARSAQRRGAVEVDAAVTVQRAWRRYRAAGALEELSKEL